MTSKGSLFRSHQRMTPRLRKKCDLHPWLLHTDEAVAVGSRKAEVAAQAAVEPPSSHGSLGTVVKRSMVRFFCAIGMVFGT